MLALHRHQVRREPLLHTSRQHRHPILLSFATPDRDLVAIEVEVLDAEFQALLEANARAVQHRHNEPHRAVNLLQELAEFFSTEHDRPWAQSTTTDLTIGAPVLTSAVLDTSE